MRDELGDGVDGRGPPPARNGAEAGPAAVGNGATKPSDFIHFARDCRISAIADLRRRGSASVGASAGERNAVKPLA